MKHTAKSESTFAIPQTQLPGFDISLEELFNQRGKFAVLPSFQRQEVWNIRMKQAEIDTILLGDHITPPEYYQERDEHASLRYMLTDGHQRVTTILSFMDDGFKTWTAGQKRLAEPGSDFPVEPGKFFSELSPTARNYFREYLLHFNQVRRRADRQMVTRFLRIQNHVPLSAAEKLNAYMSKAKDAAKRIEQHQFWDEFYEPEPKRKAIDRQATFQSSLYLLAIEMVPDGILDVQSGAFMSSLASGTRDDDITDAVVENVLARLDIVCQVFFGTHFSVRATSIIMYQAVMFLEQSGYTFQQSDKEKLTDWLSGIILESKRVSGIPFYVTPLQKLTRESGQREFWDRNLKRVKTIFDIEEKPPPLLEGMEIMQV